MVRMVSEATLCLVAFCGEQHALFGLGHGTGAELSVACSELELASFINRHADLARLSGVVS